MDRSELEQFEDELHAIQSRVEQSIRYFFQEQRDLVLENLRSPNDLRTSMENTVISGSGNSRNTWHIYLTEEPVEFNIFYYLTIVFALWLIFAVFYIIRKYNDRNRNTTYNSRNIRSENIHTWLPPPIENDRRGIENESIIESLPLANNDDEEETNSHDNENELFNLLLPPPNNDLKEITRGQGNDNKPTNLLFPSPNDDDENETNSSGNENSDQQIDINNTVNKLEQETMEDSRNVLNENKQTENTNTGTEATERKNNITATTAIIKTDISEKSKPLPSGSETNCSPKSLKVTEIETPNRQKDKAVQTKNEENSETSEKDLKNGLTNGNQNKSSHSSSNEAVATKTSSGYTNSKNKEGEIDVKKVQKPYFVANATLLLSKSKINNLPKSDNVTALKSSDDHTFEIVQTNNKNQEAIETDSKNGLIKDDQQKSTSASAVAGKPEDVKNVKKNIPETNGTKKPSENKNVNKPNDSDVTVWLSKLPFACRFCQFCKDCKNCKPSNSPKSQIVAVTTPDHHVKQDIAKENKKNKVSEEKDSKGGLPSSHQEEPKDSSSKVTNNEKVKNTKENTIEKPSENKNDASKEGKGAVQKPKDSNVTEKSTILPSETQTSNLSKSQNVIVTKAPKEPAVEKPKDSNVTEKSTILLSEIKPSNLPKSQNVIVTKAPKEPAVEKTKDSNVTEKSTILLSEIKPSNLPKSQNVIVTKAPKEPAVEKTKDSNVTEKSTILPSEIKPSNLPKSQNVIVTKAPKEPAVEKPKDSNVTEKSTILPSEIKPSNLPKSQNVIVTKTPEEPADEILKNKNRANKVLVENDSKGSLPIAHQKELKDSSPKVVHNQEVNNRKENTSETKATEKSSGNKNDDGKQGKGDDVKSKNSNVTGESIIILPSDIKTSNLPISQNVVVTKIPEKSADEILKKEDRENEVLVKKDSKDGLPIAHQEEPKDSSSKVAHTEEVKNSNENTTEGNAAEKPGGNKNDNIKEDENILEKKKEESKTLPSENKTSDSQKAKNATVRKTSDDHTDGVIKTEDNEKKDSIKRDSKDALVNKDQIKSKDVSSVVAKKEDVKNVVENITEANATEKLSGKKNETEGVSKIIEIAAGIIEKSKVIPSENKTKDSPKSQNVIPVETGDRTDDKEKKDLLEKDSKDDLTNLHQGNSSSVVSNNEDVKNATGELCENKNNDSKEDEGIIEKENKANIVEESKTMSAENKTSYSPKYQIVPSTVTSDIHTDEVVKTKDKKIKDFILTDSTVAFANKIANLAKNCVLGEQKETGNIYEPKPLLFEDAISNSPEAQNVNILETSDSHADKVKIKDEEKKDSIEKDAKDGLGNKNQEESIDISSVVIKNLVVENSPENKMNSNITKELGGNKVENITQIFLEKEREIGNIEKSLASENKIDNFPKLENVIIAKISDSHKDEVVKTENEEKKNEDVQITLENTIKPNATENLTENKNTDNIEDKGNLKKEREIDNIEVSETPTSGSKTSNSPKSQNVTATPDSPTNTVIKTEDEEKKDSINKHSEDGLVVNENQGTSTSSETDELDDGKVDDGVLQKGSEADIIEEFKTLPSENNSSTSPKTQNVCATKNPDPDVKDSPENNMETDVTENASGNNIAEVKENEAVAEKATEPDVIEEQPILPSETKTSTSSESQNVTTTETPPHHTDEVVKTSGDQEDLKSSSSVIVSEENVKTMEGDVTKISGENKSDEDDVKKVKEAHVNDSQISNFAESQNIAAAETPDTYTDEVIKIEDEEKDSTNDPMDTNQEESGSSSSGNMEVSENETALIMENKDVVENVTFDLQEEKIVKSEKIEEKLENEAKKPETNTAEDEDNKKILSEDSTEGLSNEDKISTENKSGDEKEEECDMGPGNETCKIEGISNPQSETKTESEENAVVITQNEENKIEIGTDVIEAASEAIDEETIAATDGLNENDKIDEKAVSEIQNNDNQEDTSSSGSDAEDQAASSTPNNSSSGNDQFGGQRRSRKKKKGKKSKHNRY